jgi:hypothetical protein
MKQKNKIWFYPLIVFGFLLILSTGCSKDDNLPGLAGAIAGTYNGTISVNGSGTVSCSSILTRSSQTKVDLTIIIGATNIPLDGINVSSSGSNIYNLSYSDSSGSFTGKVEGNLLTWTLSDGSTSETFSGTKL